MDGEFSQVSTPELAREITTLAGHLNAANARFLALIAELDRRRRTALAAVAASAEQVLITAAVPEDVPSELAGTRFSVRAEDTERGRLSVLTRTQVEEVRP